MTHCEIETLLHYHCKAEPLKNAWAPAYTAAIERFLAVGLIEHDMGSASGFRTTERGRVMVEMLRNVPMPVKRILWCDPRTGEVIRAR